MEINGTDFVSGATVTFGGLAATGVNVASPTAIEATTPSRAPGDGAGAVNVVVTNPDGQSGTLSRGFTYGTVIDLSIAVYRFLPTQQDQDPYEEIISHFADAVFEASNEAHKIGRVTVHTGGVFADLDDTVWVQSCQPKAATSGFDEDGKKVRFCDVFGNVNFITGDLGGHPSDSHLFVP